jgi:hypothetical protein
MYIVFVWFLCDVSVIIAYSRKYVDFDECFVLFCVKLSYVWASIMKIRYTVAYSLAGAYSDPINNEPAGKENEGEGYDHVIYQQQHTTDKEKHI